MERAEARSISSATPAPGSGPVPPPRSSSTTNTTAALEDDFDRQKVGPTSDGRGFAAGMPLRRRPAHSLLWTGAGCGVGALSGHSARCKTVLPTLIVISSRVGNFLHDFLLERLLLSIDPAQFQLPCGRITCPLPPLVQHGRCYVVKVAQVNELYSLFH